MNRKVKNLIKGIETSDGAGVRLNRVISHRHTDELNPFLMLDAFDSKNYEDYRAGFPTHPHRGIETITYIHRGGITHEDSLGNRHSIRDHQVQWMVAGSGIMHSETFKEEDHLLGLQLWLNMPKVHKMESPDYLERKGKVIEEDFGIRRVYSTKDDSGSPYTPVLLQVLEIDKGKEAKINMDSEDRSYLFTLLGEVTIEEDFVEEKTAAVLTEGDQLVVRADSKAVILVIAAAPLEEPWAWGGPIVMNTDEELAQAFSELRNGTFIKEEIE